MPFKVVEAQWVKEAAYSSFFKEAESGQEVGQEKILSLYQSDPLPQNNLYLPRFQNIPNLCYQLGSKCSKTSL